MTAIRARPGFALTLWIAVLAGLTLAFVFVFMRTPPKNVGYDFLAFWCGAKAVVAGANPYLNEPLRACEVLNQPAFFQQYPNVTVPAPLPPYALALFGPLTFLPYHIARAAWWMFLVACIVLEAGLIARLTAKSYLFGWTVCAFALTAPIIIQGALAPLPVLLLTGGAYAYRGKRWWIGSALIALAMIEPHMALPACLAAFIFLPRTRAALAAFGTVALGIGLLAVGPHVFAHYFSSVLPAHAFSELDNLSQESLTAILHRLGVANALALHLGGLQYAVLVVLGVLIGGRLSKREGDAAWAILVPAALAMIGGEFIHLSEVSMAIPLAAIIAVRRGGGAWFALALLAIPGEAVINYGLFFFPTALFVALVLREMRAPGRYVFALSVLAMLVQILAHGLAEQQLGNGIAPIADPGPGALSSLSWGAWNRLSFVGPMWWIEKALTLAPLLALLGSTIRFATKPDRQSGGSARAVVALAPSATGNAFE